jgi:predicted nucleotidyltransferase
MEKSILTKKEIEAINKKLRNRPLTQEDSNRLSRFVRPKLRKIASIDANSLLNRLNYNPNSRIIENKIKKIILENISQTDTIIVVGSAIQTNYKTYNDIDLIVITKNKYWSNQWENLRLCKDIEDKAKKIKLNLDIQIISKKAFLLGYSSSPTLIYQLKDYKIIHGKIKIPKKIDLSKLHLKMKLDWSEMEDSSSEAVNLYRAIRNAVLVKLLMNKIIDNSRLKYELIERLGIDLINHLKENKATKLEKRYALEYLNNLTRQTLKEIENAKWQSITI